MMSPLRLAYLALAVWGAVHPMYWFVAHMRDTGTGLGGGDRRVVCKRRNHRADMGSDHRSNRADAMDMCRNHGP